MYIVNGLKKARFQLHIVNFCLYAIVAYIITKAVILTYNYIIMLVLQLFLVVHDQCSTSQ